MYLNFLFFSTLRAVIPGPSWAPPHVYAEFAKRKKKKKEEEERYDSISSLHHLSD
jgi:hypothetical protein